MTKQPVEQKYIWIIEQYFPHIKEWHVADNGYVKYCNTDFYFAHMHKRRMIEFLRAHGNDVKKKHFRVRKWVPF